MTFVAFVSLLVVLTIGFVPVWLLRRAPRERALDYLVAAQRTRPAVVRNASIAYALRMAAFVPLFAWGASGEFWPAVIASACFGLGTWLVYAVREPLVQFVDDAIAADRSMTVHAFIAQGGGHGRVRMVAAVMTLTALFALVVGEALAAASVLGPMLQTSATLTALFPVVAVAAIAMTMALCGHSGVMHAAQLQLGTLYFGLFGATALVLYLHISARTALPAPVALAIASIIAFSAILLWYRRSRYVDTDTVRSDEAARPSRAARVLARAAKILNGVLSGLLVLIIVVAFLDLQVADGATLARDSIAALGAGTRMSGTALLAIALVALFYPLVDVATWLRLAALRKDAGVERNGDDRHDMLSGVFAMQAVESTLMGLVACAVGAIAAAALGPSRAETAHAFAMRLAAPDNAIVAIAAALIAICVVSAAVTTITAILAASLVTLRYDLAASGSRDLPQAATGRASETALRRRTLVAAIAMTVAAVALGAAVAWTSSAADFVSGRLPALLCAICTAQIALAPLVLATIIGRARGHYGALSAGWALAMLGAGAGCVVAAVVGYVATGAEDWLWSAAPVGLVSGLLLYAFGRAASRGAA